MHWKPTYNRYAIGLVSLVAFTILFHLDNLWAYAAAGLYAFVLAMTIPVGSSGNWNAEKQFWQTAMGFWSVLLVACPTMSIFFPDDLYKFLSLSENAMRMAPMVTLGLGGLVVMGIIAARRHQPQEVTV